MKLLMFSLSIQEWRDSSGLLLSQMQVLINNHI